MDLEYRAIIIARLEKKEAQLVKINELYDDIAGMSLAEYELDTAGDSQRGKRVSLETLSKQIELLEAQIDGLRSKLNHSGLVILRTTRY